MRLEHREQEMPNELDVGVLLIKCLLYPLWIKAH